MKRMLWVLARTPLRVAGALGLLGLAAIAAVHLLLLQPLEQQLEAARSAGTGERARARQQMEERLAREADPGNQLTVFYRYFATGETLSDQLARIYNLAEAEGIVLRQGEYRLIAPREARLRRYQIVFPVKGSYPSIRRFAAGVLAQFPVAALDDVRFERRRIGETAIEAEMRFTLYLPGTT